VILTKRLLLAMFAAGMAVIPASAGSLTWYIGGTASGTSGFSFTDGTKVSGSFTYNADTTTANCSPGCGSPTNPPSGANAAETQPGDYNGLYGLFGTTGAGATTTGGLTGSVNVTPGSFFGATPPSLTWYINTNDYDPVYLSNCCSDATNLYLVSANPDTTADLTDVAYNPNGPTCGTATPDPSCTDHPGTDAAYGIQTTFGAMTDSGNLYPTGDLITSAALGICDTQQCGGITTAGSITGFDPLANVNTGNVPASPGGTPEPSTLLLGVSALAFGAFRKKFFRSNK